MNLLRNCVISVSCFASFSAVAQEPSSAPTTMPTTMAASMPTSGPVVVEPNPVPAEPTKEDGKIKLSFSGFVAAQVAIDSNEAVGQNHLVSVAGDGDGSRLGFAFDATRLNLVAKASSGGIDLEGRAEADMENGIFFRIRHAYGAATKNNATLLLGQTDTLVGNMVGPNLFNNDWFFAQGNAYDRTQQLRVSYNAGKASIAVAAVPNLYGTVTAVPHFQARFSAKAGDILLGVGAHFGVTDGVTNPADASQTVDGVTAFLVAADAGVPLGPLFVSVQGWVSSGGAHGTGGHAIGNPLFVVDTNGSPVSVPSAGGFLDAIFTVNPKLYVGAAGGISLVTDTAPGGVEVPIESNLTAGAYTGYSPAPHWKIAFEVQAAQTVVNVDPATPDVRENLTDVRVLFGQKLSF
jgi:hypothetical protein